jgi:hypothetical protein
MTMEGLYVLSYNVKKEEIIIHVGSEKQGPVVMQRLVLTCSEELAGYRVSIRNVKNEEVAGAVFPKNKKV